MATEADIAQVFTLIVGDTPPFDLELASSVVEYLYEVGIPGVELECAASCIEYLAIMSPPEAPDTPVDPIASSFVPGPRWQMAGRPQGGGA